MRKFKIAFTIYVKRVLISPGCTLLDILEVHLYYFRVHHQVWMFQV